VGDYFGSLRLEDNRLPQKRHDIVCAGSEMRPPGGCRRTGDEVRAALKQQCRDWSIAASLAFQTHYSG